MIADFRHAAEDAGQNIGKFVECGEKTNIIYPVLTESAGVWATLAP
jgi:hypothetical protein